MIESIINYLNAQIEPSGLFTKQYCLSEKVQRESQEFPLHYIGKGKFIEVTDISKWLGSSYFRKNGKIKTSIDTAIVNYKACDIPLIVKIPLLFIGTIKRSGLEKDDAYTDSRITGYLKKLIVAENPVELKGEIRAKRLTIYVTEEETDRKQVFAQEFSGVDWNINYQYSYVSLIIDVEVHVSKACLDELCEPVIITNEGEEVSTNTNLNLV